MPEAPGEAHRATPEERVPPFAVRFAVFAVFTGRGSGCFGVEKAEVLRHQTKTCQNHAEHAAVAGGMKDAQGCRPTQVSNRNQSCMTP